LVKKSAFFDVEEKQAKLGYIASVHETNLQKRELNGLTMQSPEKAAVALEDPKQFPRIIGGDRSAALTLATQTRAKYALSSFNTLKMKIDLHQVAPDEKFEGPGTEQLTPVLRSALQGYNRGKTQTSQINDPALFHRMLTAITSYDPREGDDLKKVELESLITAGFSGGPLKDLQDQWTAKKEGRAAPGVAAGEAFKMLDRWAFDEQRLGVYKLPGTGAEGHETLPRYPLEHHWFGGSAMQEPMQAPGEMTNRSMLDEVSAQVTAVKNRLKAEIDGRKLTDEPAVMQRAAQLMRLPLLAAAAREARSGAAGNRASRPPQPGMQRASEGVLKALRIIGQHKQPSA
jgi:hypothetical protein